MVFKIREISFYIYTIIYFEIDYITGIIKSQDKKIIVLKTKKIVRIYKHKQIVNIRVFIQMK